MGISLPIKLKFAIFLIAACLNRADGQDLGQKEYTNGKDLFHLERYQLAMEALEPLANGKIASPFTNYASYYYALAAHRLGQKSRSRDMFLQIALRSQSWNNIDEVHFWLGQIYFEESNPGKALLHLSKINSADILETAGAMRKYFLRQQEDSVIASLYAEYANDREVARVIASRLSLTATSREDQEYLRNIVERHKLDQKDFEIIGPEQSIKKDRYKVAVLFPFLHDEKRSRRYQKSNFILDLYDGIRWGAGKLGEESIDLDLYAYDTERDSDVTAAILDLEELSTMDLLIGPLLPNSNRLVSEFSRKKQINMVNPISDNLAVIGNNPFSFLSTSGVETRALKAAELARNHFYPNKNAMIFYGYSSKDSIMAYTYKRAIEQDSFRVIWMPRLVQGNSQLILESLAANEEISEQDPTSEEALDTVIWNIRPDSIGHIFVASYDDQIAANTISAVESRPDRIPTIGHSNWLDFRFIEYEQLERLNIYFIAPNFINPSKPAVQDLKREYMNQVRRIPNNYFYTGYDIMTFWGRMLNQYGTYFQVGFGEMDVVPGLLSNGYQYGYSNDNQFLSIYRFEGARLVLVNSQMKMEYPALEDEGNEALESEHDPE